MIAIFKREFKAAFTGITGWLFMAAILMLYGLYYLAINLQSAYPYISYTLSSISFLLLIVVPILTMRSIAEDRRSRADQLILTAPVSVHKVVCGKFLAMAAIYTLVILVICITPLVLSLYGTVPMGESYTAILGFWLYGLTCIAIGEFVSGITESQIIAAVVTFGILFLGYMMNGICSLISSSGNLFTKILGCFDLYSNVGPFMAGTLDLTCVVYYISLIALALFLTVQVIQKRRWSMSVKKIAKGAFSIAAIIAAVAVCVGINFGMSKIPTEYTSIDVTYNKMFQITDATRDYLKNLDEDIVISVWAAESQADTTLKETLERYSDMSGRITVKYVNPTDNPNLFSEYAQTEPSVNSLLVSGSDRSRVIDYNDIYVYSYDYTNYSQSIDAYDAEGQITSAIEYVTMDASQLPTVYYLDGHGEAAIGDKFTQVVAKSNINYEKLSLVTQDGVPGDCQLLIINGPQADFSKDDYTKLRDYLSNGGNVLLTFNYEAASLPNVSKLCAEYGIIREDGLVMENDSSFYYSNTPFYLLPTVNESSYTSQITNGYVFAPYSVGFSEDDENLDYDYTYILTTSDKAVSKTNTGNITTSEYEEGDINGPFTLALAATRADETGTLIAMGTIDILTDEADEIVAGSNVSLFKGIISGHVTQKDMDLPVIESKPYTVDNLVITSGAGMFIGILIMVVVPITLLILGITLWAIRRKL